MHKRRPRLTKKEWDAIRAALAFVLAGEDPWETSLGDHSWKYEACRTALNKLG